MSKAELYPGQTEVVAGKLAALEMDQQADRERLNHTTDYAERQMLMRRIAGREGSLATQRRFLAQLRGDNVEGTRQNVVRVRLTDDEYAQLNLSAQESGQLLAQYIRSRLF